MWWIIGVDEVGRGPIAGPVAVGAFAVPAGRAVCALAGIRDSKALSSASRDAWCRTLTLLPDARYAVSYTSASVIDRCGIVVAIRRALARSLARIDVDPAHCTVLLDGGLRAPQEYTAQQTIVRGDATEPVIAAASIVAKVARDRVMVRADRQYPAYGFAMHKGYGTRAHVEAVRRHGLCPLHRRTFCASLS